MRCSDSGKGNNISYDCYQCCVTLFLQQRSSVYHRHYASANTPKIKVLQITLFNLNKTLQVFLDLEIYLFQNDFIIIKHNFARLFLALKNVNDFDCVFLSCYIRISSESTLRNWLNLKEFLARSRHDICRLSYCNEIRTHNHLVRKQTLNYLVKLD